MSEHSIDRHDYRHDWRGAERIDPSFVMTIAFGIVIAAALASLA